MYLQFWACLCRPSCYVTPKGVESCYENTIDEAYISTKNKHIFQLKFIKVLPKKYGKAHILYLYFVKAKCKHK